MSIYANKTVHALIAAAVNSDENVPVAQKFPEINKCAHNGNMPTTIGEINCFPKRKTTYQNKTLSTCIYWLKL